LVITIEGCMTKRVSNDMTSGGEDTLGVLVAQITDHSRCHYGLPKVGIGAGADLSSGSISRGKRIDTIPASSFYHIVCAIAAAERVLSAPAA
jgi:hypothetical protein